MLALATAATSMARAPHDLVLGAAACMAIALAALLLERRLKPSHHVASATFAACLRWPWPPGLVASMLGVAAIAWSRLALARHVPADVIAAHCVGTAAGLACHMYATGTRPSRPVAGHRAAADDRSTVAGTQLRDQAQAANDPVRVVFVTGGIGE